MKEAKVTDIVDWSVVARQLRDLRDMIEAGVLDGTLSGAILIVLNKDRTGSVESAGSFQMGDAMWLFEVFKSRQIPPCP